MQRLVLNQHPTMKAGLSIVKMIPAVTDPGSVMNAAVCELCNRGEKVQRCAGGGTGAGVGPTRKGEGRPAGQLMLILVIPPSGRHACQTAGRLRVDSHRR